jgi:prepilin-type N-terminal cleavage/methylation domain-containing protein
VRTRPHDSRSARAGFTLVEVLLAVTILGFVMTAVYSTWSAALTAWRRGSDASEVFQRQRIVMDALTELAQSVVYFGASPSLYAVVGVSNPGWGDSVSFVTGSDALLPPSEAINAGMRRVTISMEQDEYGRKYLALVNAPAVSESNVVSVTTYTPQAHVLSMEVSGFSIRYLDPRDNIWYEKWEETSLIPFAMEFTVAFGQQGDRLPPVVVTRAIDLPVAVFIAQGAGISPNGQPMSAVQRQNVNTSGAQNNSGGSTGSGGSPAMPPGMAPRRLR